MDSLNCSIASLTNLRADQKSIASSIYTNHAPEKSPSLTAKEKEENRASSLADSLYTRRQRIALTTCLYFSFFSLAMLCNVLGPTLVHMSYLLNVDMSTISLAFTCEWSGYLLGSLACGMIYDHFNSELQFCLFTFLMGATTVVCPWASTIQWFYAFKAIGAMTMGYIDAMGQTYVITIWSGHRLKMAMHQTMMTIYSIGATIGPLFIAPFLAELPDTDDCPDDVKSPAVNSSLVTDVFDSNDDDATNATNTPPPSCSQEVVGIENVRYSYALVGCIACACSVLFLVAFCVLKAPIVRKKAPKPVKSDDVAMPADNKHFKVSMLTVLFLLTAFHTFIIVPGWISSFVIKGLGWNSKNGPLITSVYWLSNLAGRVVAIPLSIVLAPVTMVIMYMTGTTLTLILTLFVAFHKPHLLWMAVALVGFSLATTFGTTIVWTSQHIQLTGSVSSVLVCGFSAGLMTAGAIAGYLFEQYSPYWVLYLSIIASFMQLILFGIANLLTKCFPESPKGQMTVIVDEDEK